MANIGNIDERYQEMILRAMEYHFPGAKIMLFGSRAKGTNKPGSDIDIAVDAGHKIPFAELERALITLNNLPFPLEVDLVDLQTVSETFKKIIVQNGIVWRN